MEISEKEIEAAGHVDTNRLGMRAFIIVGSLVMIVAMRWLAIKLHRRIYRVQSSFRSIIRWILLTLFILVLFVSFVVFIINMRGKQREYKEHYQKEKE